MNIRNIASLLLVSILVLLMQNEVYAQPPSDGELDNEEVEVIRDFEARLLDTEKLPLKPELPKVDDKNQPLVYEIPTKVLAVDYPPPQIKPLAMGRDKAPPVYDGYAKLGYGMFNQPFAEAGYSFVNPNVFDLNLKAFHHSGNNDKNLENQRFSLTGGNVGATYYNENGFAVSGNIGYGSNVRHLYGYDHAAESYKREEVRRRINTLDIGLGIQNTETLPGDISYHAGIDVYSINESFLASDENGFIIRAGGEKYFNEKHHLELDLIVDQSTFEDTSKQKLNNYFLHPRFTFHADKLKIRVGANVASSDDEFFIFPDIEAAVAILGSEFGAYVGWQGDLQKNNFRNLIEYNNFVESRTVLSNTEYNDWYGGIRGIFKNYNYNVQAGYKNTKDLATFLPLSSDTRQFDVTYDDVNIVYVKGTVQGSPIEDLDLMFTLGQNFFSPDMLDKAWHLPSLELNFSATYLSFEDKLKITGELYGADGVPFLASDGESERLDALYDLSLSGEYSFTENIGAWLQFNNILANKRERWQRYPMFGFNVMAGAFVKF